MKTTLNQKRFLIVWICFHTFALFVNIADIKGEMPPDNLLSTPNVNGFWPFSEYSTTVKTISDNNRASGIFKFASNNNDSTFNPDDYKAYDEVHKEKNPYSSGDITPITIKEKTSFNGIFSSYGYPEFIFYMIVGFGIVYFPRIWNE